MSESWGRGSCGGAEVRPASSELLFLLNCLGALHTQKPSTPPTPLETGRGKK